MFSFRRDKMGFFNALILIIIVVSTTISTVLILAIGGWEDHKTSIRWILGTAWVSCVVMVTVRITVFKYQREKAERERIAREQAEPTRPTAEQPTSEEVRDGTTH